MRVVLFCFLALLASKVFSMEEVAPHTSCAHLRQKAVEAGVRIQGDFLNQSAIKPAPLLGDHFKGNHDRFMAIDVPNSPIVRFSLFGYEKPFVGRREKGLRIKVILTGKEEKTLRCLLAKGAKIVDLFTPEGGKFDPRPGKGLDALCKTLVTEGRFPESLVAYLQAVLAEAGY